jgi:hypothetical protein
VCAAEGHGARERGNAGAAPLNRVGGRVEAAQHRAERDVRDQDGDRGAHPVVECQEAGWFELARDRRAAQLAGHARVYPGHDGQDDGGDEGAVQQPEHGAEPPGEDVRAVKPGDVGDRERPPVQEVEEGAIDLRAVAVGREHRPEHVGNVHARDAEPLAARHQGRQHGGGREPPHEPAQPVHDGTAAAAAADRASPPARSSSRRRASIASAALISPTWL